MSDHTTATDGMENPAEEQEAENNNPRVINRQAPPPLWKQVEDQENAQVEEREEGAEKDSPSRDDKGRFAADDSAENPEEKPADEDAEDEESKSDPVKERLGKQRDKARKDAKIAEQRAAYWEKRSTGMQFTAEEAAAAGQAFEVWPTVSESKPAAGDGKPREQAQASQETDPAPSRDEFDDYDAYVDARGAWSARKEFQRLQQEQQERAKKLEREEKNRTAAAAWMKKVEDAKARHPDLEDVLRAADARPLEAAPGMAQAVAESDVAADILYHLATNTEELHRIVSLPFKSQIVEVDRLEQQVLAEIGGGEGEPPPQPAQKAPKPTVPVSKAPPPPPSPGATSRAGGSSKLDDHELRRRLAAKGIDRPRTPLP